MGSEALVSVVIPTYNRGYCLLETIKSVCAQTHQNLEIIVVDDGSTDGTEQLLARESQRDERLRYFRQQNRGVSAARNVGIDKAKGRFIALLDSDDTWVPWKIEAQLACFEHYPSAVMVHSEMVAVDDNDRVFDKQYLRTIYDPYTWFALSEIYPESCAVADLLPNAPAVLREARVWFGDIFSHCLTGNFVHTSTVVLARAADGSIEHYDEEMRTEETFGFHLRVAKRGPVAFLDAPTTRYRRGRTDHLWDPAKGYAPQLRHDTNMNFLSLIEPYIKAGGERMRVQKGALDASLARAHAWLAESALGVGHYGEMLHHLSASLLIQPLQLRLIARLARNALLRHRSSAALPTPQLCPRPLKIEARREEGPRMERSANSR